MASNRIINLLIQFVKDNDIVDFLFRIIDEDNSGTINFMEFMVKMSNSIYFYIAVNFRCIYCRIILMERNYGQGLSGSMILTGTGFDRSSKMIFTQFLEMGK